MLDSELFLDANAHLPCSQIALRAYYNFCQSSAGHGHPSSLSTPGRQAASKLEECRAQIAHLIGAQKSEQIIFTSTCTQAAEWGLNLLCQIESGTASAISKLEHSAVSDAANQIFKPIPIILENNHDGLVVINNSQNQFNKIICVHLQNEIGIIQPIKELRKFCKYFFSDLSQSLGKLPVDVQELDIDFAIFSAHKFGGPSGVGILYIKNTSHWKPFGTGSRYALDRAGTPDVAAIVATTVALQESIDTLPLRTEKMLSFKNYIETQLVERGIEIIGRETIRSPNTTFVYLPNRAAQILLSLSKCGIYVGLGSACGSMHAGPSPTIKALGRIGNAQDYLRISHYGEYDIVEGKQFIDVWDKVS